MARDKLKKYWFISEYYWPNDNSTGHIITRIIDAFTKEYKVNILTIGNINAEERNQNTSTIRLKEGMYLDKNNSLQRLAKLIILSFRMSNILLMSVKKNDVIISVTNPAFMPVFLAVIKYIKKIKLVIIVHDLFPENLVIGQYIYRKSILYKITKKMFNYAYKKADTVISCGRDMQRILKQKVSDGGKIYFIPNFADTDILYPMEKKQNVIIKELQLENKLVVLFTGSIGRLQNIDNILNTVEILKNDDSIFFLFVGEGIHKDKIINYSKIMNNIYHINNMPREKAQIFLNAGDIGISSLLPDMLGVGVPCKTYSYMAAGKPIIAFMNNKSEIAMMIQEEGNGWIVDPNKPERLAELLSQLKNDYEQIKEKGDISYRLSKTKYSIKNITEKYINLITNTY